MGEIMGILFDLGREVPALIVTGDTAPTGCGR